MDVEELRERVEKESAEIHGRLRDLHAIAERHLDDQAMLMGGVQLVVSGQTKTDARLDTVIGNQSAAETRMNERIDSVLRAHATFATTIGKHQSDLQSSFGSLLTHVKWVVTIVVLLLAWQIGEAVIERGKAAPLVPVACSSPQAIAVVP